MAGAAPHRVTADWLASPAARAVTSALEEAGHRALFVGGCVRNALLGAQVTDLDLATDARPETVVEIAAVRGLKAVPTGIEHGTITLVHDHVPIEVTTFRADVETDGRRAVVRFSSDVRVDAARRDFTMNALYCDVRGAVTDPVGEGLADLAARRLRFVGDPARRVAEDYLRILRFFRFHAWYADPMGGIDADALAACAAGTPGLSTVSAERIGSEMLKLLAAPEPLVALGAMARAGVLAQVLPGSDTAPVQRLVHHAAQADAILRLAALGGEDVAARLRLSRADARRVETLRDAATGAQGARELGWRYGAAEGARIVALRASLLGSPPPGDADTEISAGAHARFPVEASDLMPDYRGPALGARLRQLETAWIASGMTATRAALLALPDAHAGGSG